MLDGGNLVAEQWINVSNGGQQTLLWHHRDPLNLVSRDTKPGQDVGKVLAITPSGAQVETTEGVNISQYYACLYAPNSPNCNSIYQPQAPGGYGPDKDKEHGAFGTTLMLDGARTLSLWSANDFRRQLSRSGGGSIERDFTLAGTPASGGNVGGSWRKKERPDGGGADPNNPNQVNIVGYQDSYEWVPGGAGLGSDLIPKVDHLPTNGALFTKTAYEKEFYPIIYDFLNNPDCVSAYSAVGVDLVKLLTDKGIRLGPRNTMKGASPQEIKNRLGLTQEGLSNFQAAHEKQFNAATFSRSEFLVDNSLPTILLGYSAVTNGQRHLAQTLAHELVHAGGIHARGGVSGWKAQLFSGPASKPHDLDHVPGFDDLIEKCTGKY